MRVGAVHLGAMNLYNDVELFEVQAQEGPCLDTWRIGQPVINQSLHDADSRWPHFAPEARAARFQSVHAVPMRLRSVVIGALTLFHALPGRMHQPHIDAGRPSPTSRRSPSSSTAPCSALRSSTCSSTTP